MIIKLALVLAFFTVNVGVAQATRGQADEQHTPTLPACVTEDQTSPCYWDASKSGNGLGSSFYVLPDGSREYVGEAPSN